VDVKDLIHLCPSNNEKKFFGTEHLTRPAALALAVSRIGFNPVGILSAGCADAFAVVSFNHFCDAFCGDAFVDGHARLL
jgi:hypothetical protein